MHRVNVPHRLGTVSWGLPRRGAVSSAGLGAASMSGYLVPFPQPPGSTGTLSVTCQICPWCGVCLGPSHVLILSPRDTDLKGYVLVCLQLEARHIPHSSLPWCHSPRRALPSLCKQARSRGRWQCCLLKKLSYNIQVIRFTHLNCTIQWF